MFILAFFPFFLFVASFPANEKSGSQYAQFTYLFVYSLYT